MKNILLTTVLLLALVCTGFAQPGRNMDAETRDRIESFKIAFFTKQLQLTPAESRDFWPLYNQYEREQETLRDKYDLRNKKLELMSDAEVEDFVMGQVQMGEDLAKLRRDYTLRFREVLPIRKVAMLQHVNREFKGEILREIKRRRQGRTDGDTRRLPRN